ncbi:MAG: tetratricopeptide repeat protein [Bacteroidales bacterium]|nr:tetratricopeptide repeat protein [Bacteroidales bacterium]
MEINKINNYFLNLKNYVQLLFVLTFIWIAIFLYFNLYLQPHSYILGDWLINYADGGFKRRGLSGSFFFLLQDLTTIKLQFFVLLTQLFCYFIFFKYFYKILKNRIIDIYYFTLLLSPLTLLYFFNDIETLGRKEIILFAIFAYFTYLLSNNKLTPRKEYFILFLLTLTTLLHEVIFFYTPFFGLTLYFFNKKIELKRYSLYVLSSFIPLLIIYLFGSSINNGDSIDILYERGVVFSLYGIFMWPDRWDSILHVIENIKAEFAGYMLYFVSLTLGLLHFTGFVFNTNKLLLKKFLTAFLIVFLTTLPLFIIALDWGRWLNMHFIFFLILFAFLLPEETVESQQNNSILSNKQNLKFLLLIPFCLIWSMPMYMKGFEFKKAELPFRNIAEKLSNNYAFKSPPIEAYIGLSEVMYNRKLYEKSMNACFKALQINPDCDIAHYNLCCCYIQLEQWDKATESCANALRINPANEAASINLEFISQQKRSINANNTPEYYLNLSLEYYNTQMYDKCINACLEALKLKSDFAPAYYNMCCSYIGLEKWDLAVENCEKALEIDSTLEAAKINRDWALSKKND